MTPPPARPLRVLQCITRLGLGGSERVALSLVRGFGDSVTSGVFAVHGAATDSVGHGMREELDQSRIPWFKGTSLPMKAGGMIPAAFSLRRAVRNFQPDVIHVHSETPESCVAMACALFPSVRRVPLVRTIHNSIFWRYWPRIGRWCDHRLSHARIAGVSRSAVTEFARYREDSGAPHPMTPVVVPNGIDLPVLAPHAHPHDSARLRVLFAGRFEWQKGADLLPDIMSQVTLPADVRAELSLVGSGAFEPQLRALADRPPPGWSITVQPPVSRLPDVLPQHDILFMPSRFEGLALTAIEASLCGLPLVACAVPGLRDTLPDNHPWLPPGENPSAIAGSLSHALAHPELWGPAVRSAQSFAVTNFSTAAMLDGYRALYESFSRQ